MANNIINIERMKTSVSLGADSQYVLAEMQWAGEEKSRLPITYLPFKDHLTAGNRFSSINSLLNASRWGRLIDRTDIVVRPTGVIPISRAPDQRKWARQACLRG